MNDTRKTESTRTWGSSQLRALRTDPFQFTLAKTSSYIQFVAKLRAGKGVLHIETLQRTW